MLIFKSPTPDVKTSHKLQLQIFSFLDFFLLLELLLGLFILFVRKGHKRQVRSQRSLVRGALEET